MSNPKDKMLTSVRQLAQAFDEVDKNCSGLTELLTLKIAGYERRIKQLPNKLNEGGEASEFGGADDK